MPSSINPESSFDLVFTNREAELSEFRQLLAATTPAKFEVHYYSGVTGAGKSWLRARMQQLAEAAGKKTMVWEADQAKGGQRIPDPSALCADIVGKLRITAPRTRLAILYLLKTEAGSLLENHDLVSEVLKEGGGQVVDIVSKGADSLSIGGLIKTLFVTGHSWYQRNKDEFRQYLRSEAGLRDRAWLDNKYVQEIQQTMFARLGNDMLGELPTTLGDTPYVYLFCDSMEQAASREANTGEQEQSLQWIQDLMRECCNDGKPRLVALAFGQNELPWTMPVVTHSIDGFSRPDAIDYLAKRNIKVERDGQWAVESILDQSHEGTDRYHMLSLGLAADIFKMDRDQGQSNQIDDLTDAGKDLGENLDSFQLLTKRFLQRISNEDALRLRILATNPKWDTESFAHLFALTNDKFALDAKWHEYLSFSFVRHLESDEFTLHTMMRDALVKTSKQSTLEKAIHYWTNHYDLRRQLDHLFEERYWPFAISIDETQAWSKWQQEVKHARFKGKMLLHYCLVKTLEPYFVKRQILAGYESLNWALEIQNATLGDREYNIRRAIQAYEFALQFYPKEHFETEWAGTLLNLGIAHSELSLGNILQNQEKAIECFKLALQIYTKERFPQEWAMVQNNIGNVYHDMPSGNQGDHLLTAIDFHKLALEVYSKENFPLEWALTQNSIGNVYTMLPIGNLSENLNKAILAYNNALTVYSEKEFPQDWAMCHNNLGNAYANLPTGNLIFNLEQALESYKQALKVYSSEDYPARWAMVHNNIGSAYIRFPNNLTKNYPQMAITAYRKALTIYTEQSYPIDWAMTQNNLGNAFWHLKSGDRSSNLHYAIDAHLLALNVYTKQDFPVQWAMIQNNLGNVYADLATESDRKQAIEAYEFSLEIRTPEDYPSQWAMTTANIAIIKAESGEFETAIKHLFMALEVAKNIQDCHLIERIVALTQKMQNTLDAS